MTLEYKQNTQEACEGISFTEHIADSALETAGGKFIDMVEDDLLGASGSGGLLDDPDIDLDLDLDDLLLPVAIIAAITGVIAFLYKKILKK